MPFILRPTVTATFLERVRTTPAAIGFRHRVAGEWKDVTFREFRDDVHLISLGLTALGAQEGDRIAILANTRYEWAVADMAILGARAITVPVYASSTVDDVTHILNHSEARIAFVENAVQFEKITARRSSLAKLERIVVMDPAGIPSDALGKDSLPWIALSELGRRDSSTEAFEKRLEAAKPTDLVTICYTSGTTGLPKGAMITHDNVVSVIEDCLSLIRDEIAPERESLVSFLPYSHVIGKTELVATYVFGWKEIYCEAIEKLAETIREQRPTVLFAVPRTFERAYSAIQELVEKLTPAKKLLFKEGLSAGLRVLDARASLRSPSLRDRAELTAARALLFKRIRRRFGGRLKFAVCGGAPLSPEIARTFYVFGISVLEGYGLTETAGPIAINSPQATRFGSVGRPLPEVALRSDEDGEILVRSRKVFKGYYKMPKETSEALVAGYLRTGDIGHVDADGFLNLTDRKKDLIITDTGKNIAPQKIENLARTLPYLNQFVVHGDRRPYLTALLTLNRDQIIQYANENSILFSEYNELIKNPKIRTLVQRSVDQLNGQLANFEAVRKFMILPNEFTIESGEVTPSLKIRRRVVEQRYRNQLNEMYQA